MNYRDLLAQRIRLGEDSTLEFKEVRFEGGRIRGPHSHDLANEIAAFANGQGGTLVLGVEDKTHRLLGIPLDQLGAVEDLVSQVCNDILDPPLFDFRTHHVELEDESGRVRLLVSVEVPRSLFIHQSPGGYFRRLGNSKRKLPSEVLRRLFQEREQTRSIRYDESIVPYTSPDDLHTDLTSRFLPDDREPEAVSLRKLGIIAEDHEGTARLTLAGSLMCTPEPQQWLRNAYIQAANYVSSQNDPNFQTDARDLGGPLDQQVFGALDFVQRNMFVGARKPLGRVDIPQYSLRAVFEALVNAVAHRDYSMAGAKIRLQMFTDRLQLHVPGNLSNTLTTDSMHLRQYSRNELIVSLLARCPTQDGVGNLRFPMNFPSPGTVVKRPYLMDHRGAGLPIIRQETRELAGQLPTYALIDEAELLLTLPAAFNPDPQGEDPSLF